MLAKEVFIVIESGNADNENRTILLPRCGKRAQNYRNNALERRSSQYFNILLHARRVFFAVHSWHRSATDKRYRNRSKPVAPDRGKKEKKLRKICAGPHTAVGRHGGGHLFHQQPP
jgi:hypothetical protein